MPDQPPGRQLLLSLFGS